MDAAMSSQPSTSQGETGEGYFLATLFNLLEVDRSLPYRVRQLFPSIEFLQDALSQFEFTFAPGILQSLLNYAPPTNDELKSFRLEHFEPSRVWAVYLLTLEKADDPEVCFYFGSSVSKDGIGNRLSHYNVDYEKLKFHRSVSMNIQAKIKSGFKITSLYPVCTATIPMKPRLELDIDQTIVSPWEYEYNARRALVICIEGAFTTAFWTMSNPTLGSVTGYNLWPTQSLPWTGLNTHSAMGDMGTVKDVLDDSFGLLAELHERDATYLAKQKRGYESRKADPEKVKADAARHKRNAENREMLFCEDCPTAYKTRSVQHMERHRGPCQRRRDRPSIHHCEKCGVYSTKYTSHITRHRKTCKGM